MQQNRTTQTRSRRKPAPDEVVFRKLAVWLLDNNYTHQRFADEVKCSKRMVSRWLAGTSEPLVENVQRVSMFTNNEISLFDWPTAYTRERDAKIAAALKPKATPRKPRTRPPRQPAGRKPRGARKT